MREMAEMKPSLSPDRQTGWRGPRPLDNALPALFAATAAGATGCAIQFLILTGGLTAAGASLDTVLGSGLLVFVVTWLVAGFGFFIGLLFIGLPAWAGIDKLGWMSPGAAVAAGSGLSALIAGLFGGPLSAAFLVLPGAAAGWMLHRVAYGGRVP